MVQNSFNLKTLGVALFLVASVFCLYKIYSLTNLKNPRADQFHNELKFVNIFFRHGDRAPTEVLPASDPHEPIRDHLWPNGPGLMTDLGKYRMYRVGLATRRDYDSYLGYDSSRVLAFSSSRQRCIDSMGLVLRALYENQVPKEVTQKLISKRHPSSCKGNFTSGRDRICSVQLPDGSGWGDEWRRIKVDTETVGSLNYGLLDSCKYRIEHPSPVDDNLTASADVSKLVGLKRLEKLLQDNLGVKLEFDALDLWSTVAAELNLVLTNSSVLAHTNYLDWINDVVSTHSKSVITFFDLWEQITLLSYRDRLQGEAEYIQSGTLVTSIVESQLNALDHQEANWLWPAHLYKGKRMLLYASHDSIMLRLLFSLGVIRSVPEDYESRFAKWYKINDDTSKFLNALKMPSYGMSFRVELWELVDDSDGDAAADGGWSTTEKATVATKLQSEQQHLTQPTKTSTIESNGVDTDGRISNRKRRFPYVQVSVYNQEDAKYREVKYVPVEMGTVCAHLFAKKYGKKALQDELSHFYDEYFVAGLDKTRSCPFDLWLNVTAHLRVTENRLQQLCPDTNYNRTSIHD